MKREFILTYIAHFMASYAVKYGSPDMSNLYGSQPLQSAIKLAEDAWEALFVENVKRWKANKVEIGQ